MTAYYNEIDPYAADWLRNLIDAGHIARGVVDDRSIEDVRPGDLAGFAQCHFFAGIGVWSYALRLAGWPDDRPVWTGSCPCQPFSAAGQGTGFTDERHLWPHFHWLIQERRPPVVFGEQVASKDADPWIDLVSADVEALGYAFGAVPFPSAGIGAPHVRERLFWVADANPQRRDRQHALLRPKARGRDARELSEVARGGAAFGVGHADSIGAGRHWGAVPGQVRRQDGQHLPEHVGASGAVVGLADTECGAGGCEAATADHDGSEADRPADRAGRRGGASPAWAGPTNGRWRDADWLLCRDGKWRPVEPGTFPLAHGAPARVGRLRAYGNAINAEQARVFIEAFTERR